MNGTPASSIDMPVGLRNKIALRLLPLLSLLYLLNIMDRMNVGYARKYMETDPDLSMASWVFDWGFGIFYFGYLLFEVPANLILERVGARRWMARIMITWGLVSCATAFVTGPTSFFGVRILLGIAEAGFFPGIVYYLTLWFPARERAKAMSLFMTGTAISGIVANPLSGLIVQYTPGLLGLKQWQWLFILEGLPSVLVGILVYFWLPDGPRTATWMSASERDDLVERLRREDAHRQQGHGGNMWRAFQDWRVWLLTAAYFTVAVGTNCSAASFPKMIQYRFHDFSESRQGLLTALPHVSALVAMILMGLFSDRTKRRRTAFALAGIMGAVGWIGIMAADQPWPFDAKAVGTSTEAMASRWPFLIAACVAQAGMISMIPTFWVMPTSFLSGTAAAAGIALINSIGNLGGQFGPPLHGQFGHPAMVVALLLGAVFVTLVRHDPTLDHGLAKSAWFKMG